MMSKLELKEIKKSIDELDPIAIGFLDLLDLIEILFLKKQYLEVSKKEYFLTNKELASIEKNIECIQFRIGFLIQKLRKFHSIAIESNRNWID